VVPALAIHDTMKHIGSKVATVGFGACLGMTGFLMAVGTKVSIVLHMILLDPRHTTDVLTCTATSLWPPCLEGLPIRSIQSTAALCLLLQGKRYMLQNTTMMLHHPSGVARGQASDINNEVALVSVGDVGCVAACSWSAQHAAYRSAMPPISWCCLCLQQAKELLRVRNYVNNVLAHATGQPVEKIQHDFNRNK
jgi:ATP-dependent Clp protease, protease subunit